MPATHTLPDPAVRALRDALGEAALKPTEPHQLREPRGLYQGRSGWLCTPADTNAVIAAVRICAEHHIAIVPLGGGTGLVGGQTATEDRPSLLLSTARLREIRRIEAVDNLIVAEAGLSLAEVQHAAANVDRLYPLSRL